MKRLYGFFNSIHFIMTMALIINIAVFVAIAIFLDVYVYSLICAGSVIIFLLLTMLSKNSPAVKLMIVLFMAILPLPATVIYIFLNVKRGSSLLRKNWHNIKYTLGEKLIQNQDVLADMEKGAVNQVKLSKFVLATTNMPVYENSGLTYYPKADVYNKDLIEDLNGAKKSVLISLFKIASSDIWDEVFGILKTKRLDGLDIKIVYDDYGCVGTFKDKHIFEKMKNHGIETLSFNKLKGVGTFSRYRNKKNIFIIDGKIAYCSTLGINDDVLLDAKISKMCSVKIVGDAVKSVFSEFYSDWSLFSKEELNWEKYESEIIDVKNKKTTFIQPFVSTPFSIDLINKSVYSCLIANANKSLVISTPYLLLDEELRNELVRSVRSGVDVKVLIAGKGERTRKFKYIISRYGFINLIKEGIKIYSYATDNLFNRSIIADSQTAIIGGGAFDSRKMSVHFENGVLIHNEDIAKQIKDDIEQTMEVSHLLTIKDMRQRRIREKILGKILNWFSPLYL